MRRKEKKAALGKGGKGKEDKNTGKKEEETSESDSDGMDTEGEEVKAVFQKSGTSKTSGVNGVPMSNQNFQPQVPMPNGPMMLTPNMQSMAPMPGLQMQPGMMNMSSPQGFHFSPQVQQPHPNFAQGGLDQSGAQNQHVINAAIQAQHMTTFQHAEMLRRELTNVQGQIQMTQMRAPGSLELGELNMKEAQLRQEMMRRGLMPRQ